MGQTETKQKLPKTRMRSLKRQVSFTEAEIRDWHKEFVQRAQKAGGHCKYLSEAEFVNVYNSVFPGDSDDFATHVYRTFDADHNGQVDFREFIVGLSISASSDLDKKLAWAFRVYDINDSGFITRDEMMLIVESVFKMMGVESTNADGVNRTAEEVSEEFFSLLDTDRDGQISWQEFRDGATRDPKVVHILQCGFPDTGPYPDDDDLFMG